MTRRFPVFALAFALLAAALPVRAEETLYTDQRMIEADALLADREQYPRAIALYRQVLEEFPSNSMARLWLARVLSWKGDTEQSIAEYDLLLRIEHLLCCRGVNQGPHKRWFLIEWQAYADFGHAC